MEILHRGTLPEEQTYTATCHNCKTRIRFLQKEAEYVFDQRDGDFLRIACPVCAQSITAAVKNHS